MALQVLSGIFNVLGRYTRWEHPLPHHQQLTVTAMGVLPSWAFFISRRAIPHGNTGGIHFSPLILGVH